MPGPFPASSGSLVILGFLWFISASLGSAYISTCLSPRVSVITSMLLPSLRTPVTPDYGFIHASFFSTFLHRGFVFMQAML